ncbi:unnamed protein product [Mucor hiemalis]
MYNYNTTLNGNNKKKNPKKLALKLSVPSTIPQNDTMQQVNDFYKQGPVCILPNLYLGGYRNASNSSQLNALNIDCIINVASEVNINTPLEYHHICWTHTQNNLAKSEFAIAISKIKSALSKGRTILVHCQQGIERSAALIIAYVLYVSRQKTPIIKSQNTVMQGQNWTLDYALKYVQEKAPAIRPNMELLYQLREYDKLTIVCAVSSIAHNIRTRTKRSESVTTCCSNIVQKQTTGRASHKHQLRPRSASFKESSLSSLTQQKKQKTGDMVLMSSPCRQKLATAALLVDSPYIQRRFDQIDLFITEKKNAVVHDLAAATKEEDVTDQFTKECWIRIFQHVKKQYDLMDKQFITDKEYVNWIELSGKVLENKIKNAEERIRQLANKRRKPLYDLHLQADSEVAELLTAETSTAGEIDAFFNSGPILVYLLY